MSAAVALLIAAAGTFALRYGSVRALAQRRIPPAVEGALRHAALAVIAALVVASLPSSGRMGLPSAGAVVALMAAAVVARRTRNITAAIAVAMVFYATAAALPGSW